MKTLIENYITHLKLSNASENTIRSYRGYLLDFARFADKLDVEAIEGYLGVLHKRQFSKASTRRALATLKSFGRWMVNESVIPENPVDAFHPPRGRTHIQQRLTEEQARQLCEGPPSGRHSLRGTASF